MRSGASAYHGWYTYHIYTVRILGRRQTGNKLSGDTTSQNEQDCFMRVTDNYIHKYVHIYIQV